MTLRPIVFSRVVSPYCGARFKLGFFASSGGRALHSATPDSCPQDMSAVAVALRFIRLQLDKRLRKLNKKCPHGIPQQVQLQFFQIP